MNYGLTDLKEATKRLEEAVAEISAEDVDMYVRLIRNIATQIKNDFWAEHVEAHDVVIQPIASKSKDYRTINTLEFLYKPMFFNDALEGREIEFYCKERSEELVESGAIDSHNEFWQSHEIIFGNVYGSLPTELLSKEQIAKLIRYGWKKTNVDIVEPSKSLSENEVRRLAEIKYRHYILLREKETQCALILRYNF